jgi:hypothetical protein
MVELIDIILFGDTQGSYLCEDVVSFEVELPQIIKVLNSHQNDQNISKLILCFEKMMQTNCRVEMQTGCAITKIRDVPFALAQQFQEIIQENDLTSQALQNGMIQAAGLPSQLVNDIYAVELSDFASKAKPFSYNEQVSKILLYENEPSAFNSKNCFDICRLISNCLGGLRDEAWSLEGRFLLFALSSELNSIRLDDFVDINSGKWKSEFLAQIKGTPLEQLFDPTNNTLSVSTDTCYYVAVIVGTELIPRAVRQMENIFRKLKIPLNKQADISVFPHLTELKEEDESLQDRVFGDFLEPLNEDSWVSVCLSPSCDEGDLSKFMETRQRLLQAQLTLLSTQTRVDDPQYRKFVCLSDPSKSFGELPLYQTGKEAERAAKVPNYYPPVSVIGQLGIDFIPPLQPPPSVNDEMIFYLSSESPTIMRSQRDLLDGFVNTGTD